MKKIYLSPPHLSGQEISYLQSALESNWVAPVGENLDRFEQDICDYTGAPPLWPCNQVLRLCT
ncbi:MAG: hypothetical protein HC880_17615 [Bacteroidia bacterium]|nr:hypothetical protein [Bacteroidia bacterium]